MKTKYSNKRNSAVRTMTTTMLGILMLFALETKSQTYCSPLMISQPQYEYISNVTFAGINNTTGTGAQGPTNHTAFTATVTPGITYNISVTGQTPNNNFPEWYKVWIDWNQNGLLNDAGEYYDLGYSGILPWTVTFPIPVPVNAKPGITRMRVMMAGNSTGVTTNFAGSNPCYSSVGYGEVEDYSVLVLGECAAVNTPTLSIPGSSVACLGLPASVNMTGGTNSLSISYQWKQSATQGGPYTNAGSSSTVLTHPIPAIAAGTAYYVLVATCANGPISATSNEIAFTGSAAPTVPTVTASPIGTCIGNTVSFNAQGTPSVAYSWKGPNGFTSAVQSPTITNAPVAATGVYTVVTSLYNCSSPAAMISVTVSANPTAVIQASQPQYCVGGAPLALTVTTNGNSYLWNTTATTQSVSVSPSVTTPYTVTVQNAFSCSTQAVYTVTAIHATLSVLGAHSCNNGFGGSGVLTAKAFIPSTVSWYASPTATTIPLASGSANTLGIATFSINNAFADSTIYVEAKSGVCPSQFLPVTLTVSPQPTVSLFCSPLNISAPTVTVCSNDSYTFTASGAATYTWNNGQTTGFTNTLVLVPSTYTFYANTKTFSILATSADGCTNGTMVTLHINSSPAVSATTFTNSVCQGSNVTLFASGSAYKYTWSANANNSNLATINLNPVQSDVYTVIGTAVNGCTAAASQSVTVNALPVMTVTSQKPKLCRGETVNLKASGAATYQWWVSGSFQLQGASVNVVPNVTTNYQVIGTGTNGCASTATLEQVVMNCTGIQEVSGNGNQIKVYPNPSNGEFTMELDNGAEKDMELIDLSGRVVMRSISMDNAVTLNISELSNGVYYLKVRSNTTVEVVKIVKQ